MGFVQQSSASSGGDVVGWLIPIVLGVLIAGAVFLAASKFSNKIGSDISPRIRGRSFAVLAGIVCCVAGIYAIYPYVTLWRISSALQARDGELLASFIDWPNLRENLRSDLKAKAATRSLSANTNQNASGVIGTAIGLALIDPVINSLITPEMLRAWADSHRQTTVSPPVQSAGRALDSLSSPDNTLLSRVTYAFFTSPTEFRVDISDPNKQFTATTFLSFSNLSWKLTRLILPEEDFANLNSRTAPAPPTAADTFSNIQSANAHVNNGFSLSRKGEYAAALAQFDRANELDPTSSQAYTGRGDVYRLRGEYDRALAEFNEALRLDSKNANALSTRGGVYSIMHDHDKALADVTAAIKLSPNVSAYWNNRGFAYNNKNEYDLAIADLNEALRLDQKNAAAYKNRGISYEKKISFKKR